ncbi:MAG TPA: Calx-beta domain-containing protein [Pirellulaceae bacterium]|nr:Calx-beta domain-containing protein [Pirellulaceae bacterium]
MLGDAAHEQTLSQWRAQGGYDLNSLLADPLLDVTFHATAGSPSIDAGLNSPAASEDFDGNARVDGLIDIGADEFGAGVNRATPPAAFGAPSIEITARAAHAEEGQSIVLTVRRDGTTSDTVSVDYQTIDGGATAGVDYTPVAGTLVFAPGETEKTIVVPLSQDSIVEGNEHVLLKLSNPTTNGTLPARLGWQSASTLVIDDDEAPQPINYRTLWVSNDGSDVTGDGSEASPWKSLQYAADQVGPGDYVIVKPGQYWGFQVTTDGKADAPITFHAEPGVLIDAPNPENNLDGINLEGADYVTIENFTVNDMPRTGIRSVMNTNAVIRGNTIDHSGFWGVLTGWSYNLLVEGNSVSHSVHEHGIYISNSSDDGIIRNNLVYENHDSGIQFNADGFLEGDGVHSRNIVEGNVLFGNGTGGGATINLDGFQDGIVRNNLLFENHSTGIVLYVGYAAEPSTNNVVANNTVVMASDARWALLLENASSGNTIVNNILLNKNPNRGSITADDSSRVGLVSDHNIVVDRFTANGWQTIDFAHWKAISGQDANSVLSTPEDVFIDPAAGDYRLKTSSPALDAADPQFAPAVDVYQHARPYGAGPDIGALEAGQFVSQVQFDWSNYVGYEDGGMAVLTVVRSGDTSLPASVEFTTADGTAVAGADYTSTSGVIEFRAGETTKTLVVMIANDDEIEPVEQLTVSLVNPVGTQLGGNSTAGLHIVSDDQWTPGQLQFSVEYQTVGEGDVVAVVTVVRTGGTNGQVAVDYSTVAFTPPAPLNYSPRHTWNPKPTDDDDPATAGLDYQGVAGTLVFDDGVATQSFVVPVSDDLWYEKDEAFGLRLSNPTNGATLGKRSAAWVEILNDDAKQPGRFQFSSPTYTVFEGQLAAMLTVVRVDGDNVPASVRLYNAGGDGNGGAAAWAPSDHGWAPEQLDFAAGESTKTVMIPIVDDSMVEDDEFFRLQLYSPTNDATIGDPATAVVRIRDNDSAFEWAQEGKFSASEGDGVMNVTIRRKGSSVGQAWVSFATYDGSATAGGDYASTQQTLLFGDGVTSRTVSIPVVNDSVKEADEAFGIQLLDPINASLGSYVWGSATILNDDIAAVPGSLTLSGSTYQVNENGGSLLVTVERTDGSDGTVSVDYSTSDGATGFGWSQTAYAGGDYTSTKGKLTFGPGETVKTFSVPITNDSSVEQNEVFTIKLSNAQGGATLGAVTKAVATIVEDDSSISYQTPGGSGSYTVKEDAGSAAVTLVRKGGTAAAASITLKTYEWGSAKSGVDFTPVNVVVTFAPGETTKTVAVPIVNDSLAEGQESFGVSLSNPVGTTQASWSATVNIQDDDTAPQPGVFQFQYSTFSTQENWGYAVIYVTRSGGSSGAVSVNYSTSPGTATPGVDYAPVSGTLNFADGETTKTFNIPLYDDLLNEVDEDVLLALSSPTGGATLGAQDHALLKIISNE